MTRREFFKTGAGAALVLSAPDALWSCTNKKSVVAPSSINARVAAVRGSNLFTMTRDALEAVGGIRKIVYEGERVFIKPNFVGVAALLRYGRHYDDGHWDRSGGFDHTSPQAIAQYYLDMVAGIKSDLAIIDFSIGLEGDGPTTDLGARTVDMRQRLGSWLLLASTDLMAADATATRVMSHDVANIKQLNMGYAMGLGEIHEESIEIVGEKLDSLRVEWQPARLRKY